MPALITTGFPSPPLRDPLFEEDRTTYTKSWAKWFKAVAAVLGTANETRLAFPANFSTASATPVSTGFGIGSIQSLYTQAFLITGNIEVQNNTQDATAYCRLWRSIIGIPAAGAAPAGSDVQLTILGGPVAAANLPLCFNMCYPDKNLAALRIWYYLTLDASAGTARLNGNGTFLIGGVEIDEMY